MENVLSFKTKPMYVCIDKYEEYSFNYQGWTISDNYVQDEDSPRYSQYSICITSSSINNQDKLNEHSLEGQKIADIITELIPVSGLMPVNSPKFVSFYSNLAIEDYKSAPNGWSSNYESILSSLETNKDKMCKLTITMEGFIQTPVLEQSPLLDIQHMLEYYENVEDPIKFLLFLNNSISSAKNINVFMLIGKALEIVDAIYPYHGPEKKDKRIATYFPELSEIFNDKTIKKLCCWCNGRKETRHYIKDKHNLLPHDPLTTEERLILFRCTGCLIINVIRHAFKLPNIYFVFK